MGEIVAEGADIFGDGVNVAARLEARRQRRRPHLRPGELPGQGKDRAAFVDAGNVRLKNVDQPLHVWRLGRRGRHHGTAARDRQVDLNVPSIAVLPFSNMSGDPAQDYFADGLVEDIITTLSKLSGLCVIARNSTSSTRDAQWMCGRSGASSTFATCSKAASEMPGIAFVSRRSSSRL